MLARPIYSRYFHSRWNARVHQGFVYGSFQRHRINSFSFGSLEKREKDYPIFLSPLSPSCPPFFRGRVIKILRNKKRKKKKRRQVVKAAGVRFTKRARARESGHPLWGVAGGGGEFYDGFSINHLIILYPPPNSSNSKYRRFETRHRFVLVEFNGAASPPLCRIKRSPCDEGFIYIYVYIHISISAGSSYEKRVVARLPFLSKF